MERMKINSLYPKEWDENIRMDEKERSVSLEAYFEEILQQKVSYMEDKTAKQQLDMLLSFGKSNVIFLIGFSQTGKTTFLRQYFEIRRNTVMIQDNQLILPILGLGDTESRTPYEKAVGVVQGGCNVLERNYADTALLCTEDGTKELYEFILDTRASLIPSLCYSEECDVSSVEKMRRRIDKMQKENCLGYYLILLKFYLYKYCVDIREIIIVLDNIQRIFLDIKERQEFVELLLQVYECMENYENIGRKITNHMIISVRPRDYRILKESPYVASYPFVTIRKENKFNSAELFQNILAKYGEDVTFDSETLSPDANEFHNSLIELSQKLKRKYSDMIEKLCFYDVTLILEAYKRILLNRTWVKEGKFRYKPSAKKGDGLLFDNITCIRALACGNAKVFRQSGKQSGDLCINKLIPNLLYNDKEKDYGLLILYTMKYYLRKYSKEMEWGEAYILLEEYIRDFSTVFGDKKEDFLVVTDYMFDTEILRRSMHDMEKAEGEVYNERFGAENKLYITSRGSKLWDMLKADSVLLELCREDMYQFPEPNEDSMRSSYELMMAGKQAVLFMELLKLIKHLFDEEFGYYCDCCRNGKKELYRNLFGKRPMTYRLLEGVTQSIRYSGFYNVMSRKENLEEYMFSKWREMGE